MLRVVVLLAAVLAVRGQTTDVSQCTVAAGDLPINAYIDGCTTPPCLLPQLQDVVVNIVFRAPHSMRSMTTLAVAYVTSPVPLTVPYPLGDNAVTCNFLQNSFCPIMEGEIVMYTLRMYIESFFFAGTQANIEFRVEDESSNPILCLRVGISIIDPVNRNSTLPAQ